MVLIHPALFWRPLTGSQAAFAGDVNLAMGVNFIGVEAAVFLGEKDRLFLARLTRHEHPKRPAAFQHAVNQNDGAGKVRIGLFLVSHLSFYFPHRRVNTMLLHEGK